MAEDDARTRIREAALALFGRNGVRDTSTRAILDAAGLRNPSAISYHFGSKAELIDDLVSELISESWPMLHDQVALAASGTPSVEAWARVASSSAANLVSTERGCLLARVWWEYDCFLRPDAFEEFLGSGMEVAEDWMAAIAVTFPDLPRNVAIARNLVVVRTIEWLVARRAGRILTGRPAPALKVTSPEALAVALYEITYGILTAPSTQSDEDITFG